jgi:hypothetical protein
MCSNDWACVSVPLQIRTGRFPIRPCGWLGGVCFVKRPEISGTAGDWPIMSGEDAAKNGPFRKY